MWLFSWRIQWIGQKHCVYVAIPNHLRHFKTAVTSGHLGDTSQYGDVMFLHLYLNFE